MNTEYQGMCELMSEYLEYGLHLVFVNFSISILIKKFEVPF